MNKLTLIVAMLTLGAAAAHGQRYFTEVFPEAAITRDIVYGSAPDHLGVPTTLLLDTYMPAGDVATQRPLVILVHGGGFTSGGKGGEIMQVWGSALARRGFVAASMSYRLGTPSKTDPIDMWEASLRAGQDVRAAVRYLRSTASVHGIDTSKIYLVGTSAGGFAILQASVLDDDELMPGIDPSLGSVEGASGTPGWSSTVHGLVVCWGATTDTNNIEPGDPPIIAIHGMLDKTVPYDCGESRFGFDLCGAEPLTARARNVGIYSSALLFPEVGHTLDGNMVLLDSCYRFYANELARMATSNGTTFVADAGVPPTSTHQLTWGPQGWMLAVYEPVRLVWYDVQGRRLFTEDYAVGIHRVDHPGARFAVPMGER